MTLSWTPVSGSGVVHDVLRGEVAELPVGMGASETCVASGVGGNSTTDTDSPALGSVFWYVVRGAGPCAVGTYGFSSLGIERESAACP